MSDHDKFDAILKLITNVDRRLDGIEHEATETRAAAMASRAEAVETRALIKNLQAEATETRVAVMARIDRLQDLVERMREDISVNFGRADRAGDAALGMRREVEALGREVTAMERQIQRLQSDVRELQGRGGK